MGVRENARASTIIEVGGGNVPCIFMPLHPYEVGYIKEIRRDLRIAIKHLEAILENDELDSEDTLVSAAVASAYASSATRRIQVVIDNIDIDTEKKV